VSSGEDESVDEAWRQLDRSVPKANPAGID